MGSILVGLTALVMVFLTPAVLLDPVEVPKESGRLLIVEEEGPARENKMVTLQTGQSVLELPIDTYLTGVVLSEMPMTFEMEALKAQAVAARTFTLRQIGGGKHRDFDLCDQSGCCQAWTGKEMISEKLGNGWENYWKKATAAVEETQGLVLTYGGELIDAVYFSCSGGATEDAVAVWGGEVPYLQSVESPGEEDAGKFHTTAAYTRDEFSRIILNTHPLAELNGSVKKWFGPVKRTNGGGVEEMIIGECVFKGTELRGLFGLNSTNFTVNAEDDMIIFSVYGYGHRVGMSQYGANAMAKAGSNYNEILEHYYTGAEIEKWQ